MTVVRTPHGRCWQQPNNDDEYNDIVLSSSLVVTPSRPLVVAFRGVIYKINIAVIINELF